MIIENPDIFKSWLTSILEPLCDADPAALAKYVYALVKKDKPVNELRDVMLDQLDVFLQAETKPFVEMLFTSLESNEYLKPKEAEKPPTPPPEPVEPEKLEVDEAPATNGTTVEAPRPAAPPLPPAGAPRHRVVVSRAAPPAKIAAPAPRAPPLEQTLVKVLPLTELLEEPVEAPPRRRDRRGDSLREGMDRRRRRSRSAERRVRPRRHPRDYPHDDTRRYDNRRVSRSPSPRGRYRNRSPPPAGAVPSRSRSRSPVPAREHERDRLRPPRELERDRMSRDREHRDRLSRSRDRERSRDRSRDRSRERSRGSASPRPDARPEHDTYKRRCRDFDEKGYCMRGDQCQWDHGNDPVVLEDNALTRVLAMPPPVPEYNPLVPDIWMGAPPGFAPFPPPHHPPPPPRELIHIPRVRHEAPGAAPPAPLPPRLPPPPHKKIFDYNRLGKGPQRPPGPPAGAANCSLEVKKVPRGLNDITHLNNHFCKFGKIVNIQICFEGDPEAALITFSTPTEANVAYKSTEAVLNNRFIKVFWHNPDNKQENLAPGGQAANKPERAHNASHNKVLINRDNIKATADIKLNNREKEKEKQTANGQEPKKETAAPAAPVDKSKRARELLETQLHQQRRLIQKLESGNLTAPQKNAIMDAIKSTQEGIEKLQKELVSYQGTISMKMQEDTVARMSRLQLNQVKAKKPKTREEAHKEILDAELDMMTKQQEGQDVIELMKKIDELRRQMAIQFPVHTTTIRRPHSRGGKFNTATRYTRGGKLFPGSQSVDHRPRALLISGFEPDELDTLYTHFSQFGEVSSKEVDLAVPQLVLQYKTRAHAEQAALHGKHYNDRTLSITWVSNPKPGGGAAAGERAAHNGDASGDEHKEESTQPLSADPLLRFEEEDEDDREDRSWRR